jgi:hypothetical protein
VARRKTLCRYMRSVGSFYRSPGRHALSVGPPDYADMPPLPNWAGGEEVSIITGSAGRPLPEVLVRSSLKEGNRTPHWEPLAVSDHSKPATKDRVKTGHLR